MHRYSGKRGTGGGQQGRYGLALARGHLRNAVVEHDSRGHELRVKRAQTELPLAGCSDQGKALDDQRFSEFSAREIAT